MNMRILILMLLLSVGSMGHAQQKEVIEIRGKVFNSVNKKPVKDALISALTAKQSVVTDSSGTFVLPADQMPGMIVVKYNDFHTEEVPLWGRREISVYLIPLNSYGYVKELILPLGEKKIADKAGSSFTIYSKDMDRGRNFADEMLVGNIPGVRTLQKGGMPGEGNFVSMRGTRSLTGSNMPLMVIDGMPIIPDVVLSSVFGSYSRNVFNKVSLKEINTVSVNKGFDAALFGSVASNGIIMINTDRAVDMETKVEFETVNGISMLARKLPLLDADEFREYLYRSGQGVYGSSEEFYSVFNFLRNTPASGEAYYAYRHNTDWQDEIFSPAFTTENILKVKGGDAIAKYSILAGYMQSAGIEDNTGMSRYYARFNGDMKMSRKLSMFTNVGFSYFNNRILEQGMNREINPMLTAVLQPSILGPKRVNNKGAEIPVWDPVRMFGLSNPAALVNETEGNNALYNIMISVGLKYDFTSELNLKGIFGINYDYNREKFFVPGRSMDAIVPQEGGRALNMVREGEGRSMSYYGNIVLNYGHTFKNGHELMVYAGGQLIWWDKLYEFATGINTATDYDRSLGSVKDASGKYLGGYNDIWKWFNFYANVNYIYRKQLYLGVAATADATSVSGERSDLFNVYPAVNAAWKINNASFLREVAAVNDLTLRAEYSMKGNAMLPAMISKYHYVASDYKEMSGIVRGNIPNDKLKPEMVVSTNIGLDFRTLGNKLSLSVDVYEDRTKNMVLPENLTSAYGSKFHYVNSGEMKTRGVEIGVNGVALRRGHFEWSLGATIAHEKAEITDLGGFNEIVTTLTDGAQIISRVGERPYAFYGLKADGVYTTTAEVHAAGLKDYRGLSYRAGDMRYVNANGKDQVINEQDFVVLGDPTPDFYGGVATSFRYKAFTLSAQFTYSYGNDIYNAVRRMGEGMVDFASQTKAVTNSWNYEGHETTIPKADYGDPMHNSQFSSRWIEDGSYLKLKNLTLNYEHPSAVWIFTRLQAYITAENVFTCTKYLGYDPEFAYSYDHQFIGVDYGKVPGARTFKLGIRLGF